MTFATLHVVGSNNNRPTAANPAVGNGEEWRARNEANIAWLAKSFEDAESEGSDENRVLNFTRVETSGDKVVHWVRATVDTGDPEVFSFQPEIVAENVE